MGDLMYIDEDPPDGWAVFGCGGSTTVLTDGDNIVVVTHDYFGGQDKNSVVQWHNGVAETVFTGYDEHRVAERAALQRARTLSR